MNIDKLLIITIVLSISTVAGATNLSIIDQPLITTDQNLSHDSIYVKDSGVMPDSSTLTLAVKGAKVMPRKSVDVVLVIDISNSMAGPHIGAAQNAVKKFMSGMDKSRDKVGIVTFNTKLGPRLAPQSNFTDVTNLINAAKPGGNTCLSIGLNEAVRMLNDEIDGASKAIVFLSDGNNESCISPDNPCADAAIARDNGTIIYAVGINDSGKGTNYLKCMAETTGGSYISAEDGDLVGIYEDLSKNIPHSVGKDVIVRYEVPKKIDIKNIRSKWLIKRESTPNVLYGYLGTISSNETKYIYFDISSKEADEYRLGVINKSEVTYVSYAGEPGKELFSSQDIVIKPVLDPGNHTEKENDTKIGESKETFVLNGKGKVYTTKDSKTNITIRKIVGKNETSGLPQITIQIITPPVTSMDFVLAIDSSGSMHLSDPGDTPYEETIRYVIPSLLGHIKSKNITTRVSVLGWDEDDYPQLDFAYGNISNNDYPEAKLVPLDNARKEITTLLGTGTDNPGKFICDENDATNFDKGINASIEVLRNPDNKPNDPIKDKRFILFITGRGEFENCSEDSLRKAANDNITIHTLGLGVMETDKLYRHLKLISAATHGENESVPPGFAKSASEAIINRYMDKIVESPIIFNATIVDTLYPYLIPKTNSIAGASLDKNDIDRDGEIILNPDGSRTMHLSIGDLGPGMTKSISFDVAVKIDLPVDVVENPNLKFDRYSVNESTPTSQFVYTWHRPGEYPPIELPENEISIFTTDSTGVLTSAEKDLEPKASGIESGIITIICILFALVGRRVYHG